MSEIKSGAEIVEEFFRDLPKIEALDKRVVDVLVNLHSENKLTATNFYNALDDLRKTQLNDKN